MTVGEMVAKLTGIAKTNPGLVVVMTDGEGFFQDPHGLLASISIKEEIDGCCLPVGDHAEVLVLHGKSDLSWLPTVADNDDDSCDDVIDEPEL